MKIEIRKLSEIFPYEKNARKIPQSAVDAVALSLKTYGWQQPIVVDKKGVIVVGHARRMGALQLGWTEAPITVFEGTAAQAKAYRLMDNRSHEEATWEPDLLRLELLELKALDLDIAGTGFNSRELDAFLRPAVGNEDEAPPVPEVAVTQPGDLWTMGEHRLLCGDATDANAVKRAGNAAICFTSPPYNAGAYTLTGNVKKKDKSSRYEGQGDSRTEDEYVALLVEFTKNVLTTCKVVAVNMQQLAGNKFAVLRWVNEFRDHFVDRAVWYKGKGNPAMAPSVMASRYEDFWIFAPEHRPSRAISTAIFRGTVSNVFESVGASSENNSPEKHCATMPCSVARYAIESWTERGLTVLDPFAGTGTTLIACQLTERKFTGIEKDARYCDVAVKRWQNLTGKQAYNQDGVCFPA